MEVEDRFGDRQESAKLHGLGAGEPMASEMTLLDRFACEALRAFHTSKVIYTDDVKGALAKDSTMARWCYNMAKAMMKERKKHS